MALTSHDVSRRYGGDIGDCNGIPFNPGYHRSIEMKINLDGTRYTPLEIVRSGELLARLFATESIQKIRVFTSGFHRECNKSLDLTESILTSVRVTFVGSVVLPPSHSVSFTVSDEDGIVVQVYRNGVYMVRVAYCWGHPHTSNCGAMVFSRLGNPYQGSEVVIRGLMLGTFLSRRSVMYFSGSLEESGRYIEAFKKMGFKLNWEGLNIKTRHRLFSCALSLYPDSRR
jgi:hypothetical protein